MATDELRRALTAELAREFERRDFVKKAGVTFAIPLAPDFVGRFTGTTAKAVNVGAVAFMPLIGVRYEPAQLLIDRATGYAPRICNVSIQTPLSDLAPDREPGRHSWEFSADAHDRSDAVSDLMRVMDAVGLPWVRSLADTRHLLAALETGACSRDDYVAAVVTWASGEREIGAHRLAEIARRGTSSEPGSQASYFGEAAANTLAIIGESEPATPA